MKIFQSALLGACLMLGTGFVSAADFELALSGGSASAEYIVDSSSIASGGADLRLGALFNEDDDFALNAGILVRSIAVGDKPYAFGLGAKFYYANIDEPNADASALTLGFSVKYLVPANTPVGIGGEFYFAPDITTFGDGDQMLDLRIRGEVAILPSAVAFVGYRYYVTDLGSEDHELDNNIHLGARLKF